MVKTIVKFNHLFFIKEIKHYYLAIKTEIFNFIEKKK